jgi:hypothetical protein
MNVKLKKGVWYVALTNGLWSLGRYLGKSPTHYMFDGSPFAADLGMLCNGLRFDEAEAYFFIEVPEGEVETEGQFIRWLMSVLPE